MALLESSHFRMPRPLWYLIATSNLHLLEAFCLIQLTLPVI